MKSTNLTIVMPTYNRADVLRENVSSLLKSNYDFELLIIDDGSTDDTEEVVKTFQDRRITYIKHSTNAGYPRSLNEGIKHAKNPRVLVCEDDVFILDPDEFFEVLISELGHKTIVATRRLENGKEIKLTVIKKLKRFFSELLAGEVYGYYGHKRRVIEFCNNCFAFNRDELGTRFEESIYIGNVFRIESDFHVRARREGATIIYNPRLLIDHRRYRTGGLRLADYEEFLYQCMVNHIAFLRRYYSNVKIYFYILFKLLAHPTKWFTIQKALRASLRRSQMENRGSQHS